MAIPKYDELMLPLLEIAADEKEHSLNEAVKILSQKYRLSEEEVNELLPSGVQTTMKNRVGWARTHLKKAGLLKDPKRGHFKITDRGKEVLDNPPEKIDRKFLSRYPEFEKFITRDKSKKDNGEKIETSVSITPMELLEQGFQEINNDLADELLKQVKNASPSFFEKLVIDLLLKMGYGGSLKDAGKAIGKKGDEGIDGIIKEDKFGLDAIYIQAKRWDNTVVGRPEIQKFVGALHGKKARKGIFITTSYFSPEAEKYASNVDGSNIVLVDGNDLTKYMIENDVGVSVIKTYDVKRLDSDYFDE